MAFALASLQERKDIMELKINVKELSDLAWLLTNEKEITISDPHTVTLAVKAREDGTLYKPLSFEGVKINRLGIYDVKGMKVWVVKE